jgi:hypothetical protein
MEEAAELGNYLPLSFKTPKEQEYIEFLWDAFETNYTHGKYRFAFLAYLPHLRKILYRHRDVALGYGLKVWPEDLAKIKAQAPEAKNLEGL